MVPMKNQYEQQCNAAALQDLGIPVIQYLNEEAIPTIEKWLLNNNVLQKSFPNNTEKIVDKVLKLHKD